MRFSFIALLSILLGLIGSALSLSTETMCRPRCWRIESRRKCRRTRGCRWSYRHDECVRRRYNDNGNGH